MHRGTVSIAGHMSPSGHAGSMVVPGAADIPHVAYDMRHIGAAAGLGEVDRLVAQATSSGNSNSGRENGQEHKRNVNC